MPQRQCPDCKRFIAKDDENHECPNSTARRVSEDSGSTFLSAARTAYTGIFSKTSMTTLVSSFLATILVLTANIGAAYTECVASQVWESCSFPVSLEATPLEHSTCCRSMVLDLYFRSRFLRELEEAGSITEYFYGLFSHPGYEYEWKDEEEPSEVERLRKKVATHDWQENYIVRVEGELQQRRDLASERSESDRPDLTKQEEKSKVSWFSYGDEQSHREDRMRSADELHFICKSDLLVDGGLSKTCCDSLVLRALDGGDFGGCALEFKKCHYGDCTKCTGRCHKLRSRMVEDFPEFYLTDTLEDGGLFHGLNYN